jgi:hypothetical protein
MVSMLRASFDLVDPTNPIQDSMVEIRIPDEWVLPEAPAGSLHDEEEMF